MWEKPNRFWLCEWNWFSFITGSSVRRLRWWFDWFCCRCSLRCSTRSPPLPSTPLHSVLRARELSQTETLESLSFPRQNPSSAFVNMNNAADKDTQAFISHDNSHRHLSALLTHRLGWWSWLVSGCTRSAWSKPAQLLCEYLSLSRLLECGWRDNAYSLMLQEVMF